VRRYAFDNAADEAASRFAILEACYDRASRAGLRDAGVGPGWRCLEVGGGGGSIGLWLCDAVGPGGRVSVTDIAPERIDPALSARGNATVLRHDITADQLPAGEYDLIHARLVLLHLRERLEVLSRLVGALAPGGWLVLDEFDCEWIPVLATSAAGQAELFQDVHSRLMGLLTAAGADIGWGRGVYRALLDAGLEDVAATVFAQAWPGGGTGIGLHRANTEQLRDDLLRGGLPEARLKDFWALLGEPGFAVQSYPLISARGRRPTGAAGRARERSRGANAARDEARDDAH
jgi:ubiquinone/menaquinone biosynthesis C-methylase UbiE